MTYTFHQLADALGLHYDTIRKHFKLRYFKAEKLNGSYRVNHRDAERYAARYLSKNLTHSSHPETV